MAQDRDTQPHWYVAHTYSGYENKVRQDLETIVENRRLQDLIQEVRVPTETVVDADGKEKESKLFPGYVLVKMIMTDETWYVVRNARGVTGFVGPSSKPIPLSEEEVEKLGVETPVRSAPLAYKVGDNVHRHCRVYRRKAEEGQCEGVHVRARNACGTGIHTDQTAGLIYFR